MNFNDQKWNLNREPTKIEKYSGIFFSIFICVILGYISYIGIFHVLQETEEPKQNEIVFYSITTALFLLTAWILYRIVFGKAKKPSPKAILIAASIMCIGSIDILLAGFMGVGSKNSVQLYSAAVGFTGVAWSIYTIKRIIGKHENP